MNRNNIERHVRTVYDVGVGQLQVKNRKTYDSKQSQG
jgi:hypothetical protein